jgi:hypothetical protein
LHLRPAEIQKLGIEEAQQLVHEHWARGHDICGRPA